MRKKLFILAVFTLFLSGCFYGRKQTIPPNKPHETPTVYNFKSTPQDDAKIFQTMGLDYLKEGDYARSKEYLNKAVKLDPKLYWSWYALGLLEIDNPKGYAYLKRSTEENPDFPIPYYWMAYYYCRNNEDRKAVELFKKYIDLAQGSIGEEDRLSSAREILLELQSGKDGAILKKIRNKP